MYVKYDRKFAIHIFTSRENNRLFSRRGKISVLARENKRLFSRPGKINVITVYEVLGYRKYVIKSLIHGHFSYWPGNHPSTHICPRLRLGQIWESRDDNQANMKMPMY